MKVNLSAFFQFSFLFFLLNSCSNHNSKFAHLVNPEKKELLTIQKKYSECSDNEKLIGCWTTQAEKALPNGKTFGEQQLENTEILIFYKDSSFANTTIVGSSFSQDNNPYISYMYGYSVSNDTIIYRNREGTITVKPIKITEDTLEFWGHIYIRGNCSE